MVDELETIAPPECQCEECRAEREARDVQEFWCEHASGCSEVFRGSVREYHATKAKCQPYCCPKHRKPTSP